MVETPPTVFVLGATGFVGSALIPVLEARGMNVRCGSRHPPRRSIPGRSWVRVDAEDSSTLESAFAGCNAVVFLVHRIAAGADYPEREKRSALNVCRAAANAGVERLVYLGGVAPRRRPSKHLRSRLETGAILRRCSVPAIELRAAMIIGAGSASWRIIESLARRLPLMLCPSWLRNHAWPIAIDDVVTAIADACQVPIEGSGFYDIPGPERVTHEDLLQRAARHLGRRNIMIPVPLLTPKLSSYWLRLVSREDLAIARELVNGLRGDLDPRPGHTFWDLVGHGPRVPIDEAIELALQARHGVAAPLEARI